MTFLDKIKLTFLTIFTLGLIWIWLNKKNKTKNELSSSLKITVNLKSLTSFINKNNIKEVTNTQNKVKIIVKDMSKVNKEGIKKLRGISGTMFTSTSITIIVGNSANSIAKAIG